MGEEKGYTLSEGARVGEGVTFGDGCEIRGEDITIGDNVSIGDGVSLVGKRIVIGNDSALRSGASIRSATIEIGRDTVINSRCDIMVYDHFSIGDIGFLGSASFRGREIRIGDEFFSSTTYAQDLTIGGGGRNYPTAICTIGHRCTMHNNFINIAKRVDIGDDVGLSPDTIILTHGYWQSVLEGHSSTFLPVRIGDLVWIGMRVSVMPGVTIGDDVTVGTGSVVTKDLPDRCVAAGVPAKVIRSHPQYPREIDDAERNRLMLDIMREYALLIEYKGFTVDIEERETAMTLDIRRGEVCSRLVYSQTADVPSEFREWKLGCGLEPRFIFLSFEDVQTGPDDMFMDLRNYTTRGPHTDVTDDLRDFMRREGIRFYGRKFSSFVPTVETDLKQL